MLMTQLPGELYTPNQQCYIINGNNSYYCGTIPSMICRFMYCTDPKTGKCVDKYLSAATGTTCGPELWCKQGMCVLKGSNTNYHWWCRSFLTSGFTAVYFFIYCIHYFVSKLELQGGASTFLYFGYMLIVVLLFFLLTGTIGFCACFWFVTKLYSVVKCQSSMETGDVHKYSISNC